MRLSPKAVSQIDSPIGTAYALVERRRKERELLDLAQAAPQYRTAPAVVEHNVEAAALTDFAGRLVAAGG